MTSQQAMLISVGPNTATNEYTVQFNSPLFHSRYSVKWVQVIGATFPGDSVFVIEGYNNQTNIRLGTTIASNNTVPHQSFAFPIEGANSTVIFDNPMKCIEIPPSTKPGLVNTWSFKISSTTNALPSFTSVTMLLVGC